MYYAIETSSLKPNDLRSGIDTRSITIQTHPGRTNQSHQERVKGWLGCTNDVNAHALGEWPTLEECRAAIREMGFIPREECCEAIREADASYCVGEEIEEWFPKIDQYEQLANEFGDDALDRWLYDARSDVRSRLENGESADAIMAELESEANSNGYTLVRLDWWMDGIREEMRKEKEDQPNN